MLDSVCVLGASMPDLSIFQYNAVDNIFSMTVATMAVAATTKAVQFSTTAVGAPSITERLEEGNAKS